MSDERPLVRDDEIPNNTVRSLVVYWDLAEHEVWMDTSGFSILEVPTVLRLALDVAEAALPVPYYADEESDE